MKKIYAIVSAALLLASCADFTDLKPKGMNMLSSGTMYKTDNDRWLFLANGFTCAMFEFDGAADDYRTVFQGVLCQPPANEGGVR